jgi:hypothetical protein
MQTAESWWELGAPVVPGSHNTNQALVVDGPVIDLTRDHWEPTG